MSENVVAITDSNFENEVTKSSLPVLLDFWAPWCGPCRMLGPIVEKLADDYKGKVKVGKVNTDDNPETATKYRISAIPTLMIFKGGKLMEQIVGMRSKDELAKLVDNYI
ncbi:MAG: thioredoxin [Planctomycetes bacterium]|nr:thioredoxin [Planctomycetota bacterium]